MTEESFGFGSNLPGHVQADVLHSLDNYETAK